MRHIADRFTATLDANVLYPFLIRDVLLSLAEAGLYRPVWSSQIQDEWSSHLIKDKPGSEQRIRRTMQLMDEAFPEAIVEGYENLIDSLTLPDANDRHVLAVAIRSGSSVIVTQNLKHFPAGTLAQYDIEAHTADEFILNTVQLYPVDAVETLRIMREGYDNPPMTADEFLVALVAAGLVSTAAELKPYSKNL